MDRLGLYDSDALPQFSYEFIRIARTVGLGLKKKKKKIYFLIN